MIDMVVPSRIDEGQTIASYNKPTVARVHRVWLLSDLHQEFVRDREHGRNPLTRFDPAISSPPDFDVVVLPGDIDVPLARSIDWVADRFAGVPVIYVPGNHDYYVSPGDPPQTINEIEEAGLEAASRAGVHLLLNDELHLGGVRYLGGTLWTNFALGRGTMTAHIHEARGRLGMNDYRSIRRWSEKYPGRRRPLRPEDTIARHEETRRFINGRLKVPYAGTTVVVTHHAPLAESVDLGRRLPWCYASKLDDLFIEDGAPALWLHGHIHEPVNYMHEGTRVVSNPRGYAFQEKQGTRKFDPGLVIEVPMPSPIGVIDG